MRGYRHIIFMTMVSACTGDAGAVSGQDVSSTTEGPTTGTTTPTSSEGSDAGIMTSDADEVSTGGAESTGSTGGVDTSTGEVPGCGDGMVGPGEECDDGFVANTENGACLPTCVLATCGDGFVQDDVEQCDLGDANSHDFGGCIPETCVWGPRCGDGEITPGHELCDPGTPDDPEGDETISCGQDCRFEGRVVFLSSLTYSGDLDGVDGADGKCRELARIFDPDRYFTYRAWLSDDVSEPATSFDHGAVFADIPYVLLNGVQVAASFDDLVENGPAVGITITDTHQSVTDAQVWTHTTQAGTKIPDTHHCEQWTSDGFQHGAMIGRNALPDGSLDWPTWSDKHWWTRYEEGTCNSTYRLYCFEN